MNTLPMPLDRIAHVLGDPVRLRILDLLAKGRRPEACCSPMRPELRRWVCACDLRPALEGMIPSRLAYHLKELRAAKLVLEESRGKWVYYTLNEAVLEGFATALLQRYGRGGPQRAARLPAAGPRKPSRRR